MLKAYCTKALSLVRHKGQDKYQEAYPTDTQIVYGFVEYRNRAIPQPDGTVVASIGSVSIVSHTIIDSDYSTRALNTISYRDKIVIDGVTHAIISIAQPRDFRDRFTKVYIA